MFCDIIDLLQGERKFEFDGENEFLSNFYHSPIFYEGIVYPTNEHFFQAMKTLNLKEREAIAAAPTPGVAKRMGRKVQLRSDWEDVKIEVMKKGLELKFRDYELAQKLIDTGDEELIEGNWWNDTYWGVCNGIGKNMLGKLFECEADKKKKYYRVIQTIKEYRDGKKLKKLPGGLHSPDSPSPH